MGWTARHAGAALATTMALCLGIAFAPKSSADPAQPCTYECLRPDNDLIQPLPPVVLTTTNWQPKFPFPYNQTRNRLTEADFTAAREMCQWYKAQYQTLIDQIDRLQYNRIQQNGPGVRIGSGTDWDYSFDGLQQQVDIVTANIDQAVAFLTPRARALTQAQDFAGNNYFPLYEGESFYLLWQHLSNVNDGIKSHQPDWFTGPSVLRVKRWGSSIHRSGVCE